MAAKPRFDGEWVRLGELISKAKSKRCGSVFYPVLSMTMHDGIVEQSDRFKKKIASRDTSSYKVVEPGQLVVGFPIDEGVIYVQNHPCPGIMSPAYNVWDINGDLIDAAYLELVLHGPKSMAYYADKMRGTTARRRSLTADNLCAMRVPLPNLERQRGVVHLFNTVKNEIAIADKVVEALDQLVKSRFAEMFGDAGWPVATVGSLAVDVRYGTSKKASDCGEYVYLRMNNMTDDGRLDLDDVKRIDLNGPELEKCRFVEMFENDSLVERAQLKDICSLITDGTHQSPRFQGEGIPFLFVSNIADNKISYETTKFISKEDYEALIARTPIEVGDVLVSAVGSFGHPAIVKDERPFCFQRHIAYLKPIRERVNSSFLHAALLSEESQQYMDKAAKGAAQRTVTLRSFKDLAVPLPPLALQQEFADFAAEVDKSRFVVRNKSQL